MDRDEAIALLKGGESGVQKWNSRIDAGELIPSLAGADFSEVDLRETFFNGADLREASFRSASLDTVYFWDADLTRADFTGAKLHEVDFHGASLRESNFREASLGCVYYVEADLANAIYGRSVFRAVLLGEATGLESVTHTDSNSIDVDTIIMARGRIPDGFLRGCGIPEPMITYLPSILGSMEPIQFHSCFISYSTKDQAFADRLHAKLVNKRLRVWYAPSDVQGGKKLHDQIDKAIRMYDKLLLVLSPNSLDSEWVRTEIRKARRAEKRDGRRKLFPIRLMSFDSLRDWECFDADSGKDLGVELREYYIPDFTNWKKRDAFNSEFEKLLRDLKSEESLRDARH